MNHTHERGNVFFYILMAVALLGALTYAISQGSRSTAGHLTGDQARVAAMSIIDYGNAVAGAVGKLKLRGCTESQISFESSFTGATYTNASAPTNKTCHVFDTGGGQINWAPATQFSATAVELTGGCNVASVGTTSPDMVLVVENISLETCQMINERLGVATSGATPITLPAACDYAVFTGTFPAAGTLTHTNYLGRLSGCVKGTGTANDLYQNAYHFYQVLLAR